MKNYQYNLIFGVLLAIHSNVIESGWIADIANIVSIVYIFMGIIQQYRDK
jgi:hypothetical protein